MQSNEDLLALLNLAKPMIYGQDTPPFRLTQLTRYAFPRKGVIRYKEFKIRKKSGGERTIHAPVRRVKTLQKTVAFILQCVFDPHQAAMGFVRGKSMTRRLRERGGMR